MPIIVALAAGYIYGAYIQDDGLTWNKGLIAAALGVWAYMVYKTTFKG